MTSPLWSKRDTIGTAVYAVGAAITGLIFHAMGGDPFSWFFALPFIAGYLIGRITKILERL